MLDFLEHVSNPLDIVRKADSLLETGGILLIALPNEGSLLNGIADQMYRLTGGVIKKPVELLHVLEHPSFFDRQTLSRLLRDNGFEVVNSEMLETDSRNFNLGFFSKAGIALVNGLARLSGRQNRFAIWAQKK